MTESADDAATHPPRDRTPLALAGVVVAFAVINALMSWIAYALNNDNLVGFLMLGAAVVQPALYGVWTALGAGSILMRVAIVLPSVLLVIVVPGYVPPFYNEVQRGEFIVIALACLAIYLTSLIVFLIFRRLTKFRLRSLASGESADKSGIRFSVKNLLAVTTIYSVVLGLAAGLTFQTSPPPPSFLFGPDFFIFVVSFGGAILTAAVLPTVAVPLAILHGHPTLRAAIIATAIWAVATLALIVYLFDEVPTDAIGIPLVAQTGAILTSAPTAFALRYFGLRLTRPISPEPPTLNPQPLD